MGQSWRQFRGPRCQREAFGEKRVPSSFVFSCLLCRRGLAGRGQGQNSPASTFPGAGAENLGKDAESCIPLQPVLRLSQDGGGRQITAQDLQLWI